MSSCSRPLIFRLFSDHKIQATYTRDWKIDNHPAPPSLLDDGSIDLTEEITERRGRSKSLPLHRNGPPKRRTPREHAAHRTTIKKAFPEGWSPPRKLSRAAMDGLRELHAFDPKTFTTPILADKFRISPEAVRRILKSKWEPTREQRIRYTARERQERQRRIINDRLGEMKQSLRLQQELREMEPEQRGEEKTGDQRDRGARGIDSRDRLFFS
jgi:hypothetical protein